MNARSRLFTSFMVLCVFSQAFLVQGQTFKKVRFLKTTGDKTNEIKAHLIVTEDSIQVRDSQFSRTLKEVPYSEIKDVTYSFSKHRRWGKKHWLTFETEEDRLALRLDKSNFKDIRSAVDRSILSAANRRLQDAVALDGYREGANRIDTPSLENKGESTQDIERMMTPPLAQGNSQSLVEGERRTLPKASYSGWQDSKMPRELREWITAWSRDLPNFICDYTETEYVRLGEDLLEYLPDSSDAWIIDSSNSGQVRYVDGSEDRKVSMADGLPSNEPIWKVSGLVNHFTNLADLIYPASNYRLTPDGPEKFSFRSDSGYGLHEGFTKDGRIKGMRGYPTWGTVWVQEPKYAVLRIMENMEVAEGRGRGFYRLEFEYADFRVGDRSYRLPKRVEVVSTPRRGEPSKVVQDYSNYRRFEVDSTIRYGPEVATVQPDTGQAPGGTGGESPTAPPAPETGWEDGADPDSARVADRSPTIPPQPPRAAPQPPLSAVLTSPKRNAPFEGTPTDYVGGGGGGSENRPLKRYGYHSTHQPPPDSFIPSRYGYYGSEPSLDSPAALTGDLLSRYGYHPVEYTPLEPKEEEEAAARSVSWWFVLMVGIVAFSGGFFGNFLRGKAE